MSNNISSKRYLLICEIGPIVDFVTHSRKTIDLWSASFVFSYLMKQVAKEIERFGEIFIPDLNNDPLFTGKGIVYSGSIPDQIYAIVSGDKKESLKNALQNIINDTLKEIASKIKLKLKIGYEINIDGINEYFNFFYIIHEIKKEQPDYNEFIEASNKLKMRSFIRTFEQNTGENQINKWKKCSLCGDRESVYYIPVADKKDFYDDEYFCIVCIIKRYLKEIIKQIVPNITEELKYQSTSDIALTPIKEFIEKSEKSIEQKEYKILIEKCEKEKKGIDASEKSEGRFFYDLFRENFSNWKKEIKEKYPKELNLKWLDRPFYSIVYMDGDNMSDNLKENKDENKFRPYVTDVSKILSSFTNGVNNIVSKYYGKLIFAGGEDINFIVHPKYLLDCINELNKCYKNLFKEKATTEPLKDKFTLSVGVCVAYHKYPLSQTIRIANDMLHEKAKKYKYKGKEKNATAISLIKGHTETLNFVFSNENIKDLIELKNALIKSDISRTTPYRILELEDLFKTLSDTDSKKRYLCSILSGTRNISKKQPEIEKLADLLLKLTENSDEGIETMIDALLYARFLAGDK
ncbi:MAG: type III-B CRISPR-associated protein Cas10/Cmr2 [Candidatus Firestonebacteria bacterium]|nr:type III-B CRISPR-associated protein Cas10/Cmr2 [Candidatus Firestonebacteria bacterium]